MNIDFSVKNAVEKRYSVRTYEKRAVGREVKEQILAYAENLPHPLGPKIRIQFIGKEAAANGEKLGTYGVIKGADLYVGVTVPNEAYALESLGYAFEQLVLYMTSLGLGTCWLGGTFNRAAFTAAMDIKDNEIFPILSPVGYPSQKRSLTEQVMRRSIKANARLPWEELFFKNSFKEILKKEDAGAYGFSLEMVRLAPSAVNKQPWRIVADERGYHFFEKHSLANDHGSVDMQRIDVGIGICHFHLAAQEKGLRGHFERNIFECEIPKNMTYIISWIIDKE